MMPIPTSKVLLAIRTPTAWPPATGGEVDLAGEVMAGGPLSPLGDRSNHCCPSGSAGAGWALGRASAWGGAAIFASCSSIPRARSRA
jgi:hypothetical protein